MKIDTFELMPVTRTERYMYAIIERLEALSDKLDKQDDALKEPKKKTTRKKKTEGAKDE